jgi:hypothetical protein
MKETIQSEFILDKKTKCLEVAQALNRYIHVAEVRPKIPIPFVAVALFLPTSAAAL